MKKNVLSLLFISLGLGLNASHAQQIKSILTKDDGRFIASFRDQSIKFEEFSSQLNAYFGLGMDHSFVIKSKTVSNITGIETAKYKQYYNGYLVQNSEVLVRIKAGQVISINGRILPKTTKSIDFSTLISEKEAENIIKSSQNILFVNYSEPAELVILHDNIHSAQLVYKKRLDGRTVQFKSTFNEYFVNAQTGKIVKISPKSSMADVPTTAHTFYSGVRPITSDLTDAVYTLKDNERNIVTLNASGLSPDYSETATVLYPTALDYTNSTDVWDEKKSLLSITVDEIEHPSLFTNLGINVATFRGNRLVTKIEKLVGSTYVEVGRYDEIDMEVEITLPYTVPASTMGLYLEDDGDYKMTIIKDSFMLDFSTFSLVSVMEFEDSKIEYNFTDLSEGTREWVDGLSNGSYTIGLSVNPALDAHWGITMSHDFYKNKFGRVSFDGEGTKVTNYYNGMMYLAGTQNNAAAMNAPYNAMAFGTGEDGFNPFVILDVTGHEYSHLVVGETSMLEYTGESGALNESFADMMGIAIENYAYGDLDEWLMGDGLHTDPEVIIRSMSNPNEMSMSGVRQPDTYLGTYWAPTGSDDPDNGGVHINSGVGNFWFYLLSEGGEGVNDNGDSYNVPAIGIEKAQTIAYTLFTEYLTATSQYEDAYEASKEVVIDIYGEDSEEYDALIAAWYAVGFPRATGVHQDAKNNVLVNLYPNPSKGTVNVNILDGKKYHLNVYNVLGQIVYTQSEISGLQSLSLESLNAGMYTFELKNDTNYQAFKVNISK